MPKDTERGTRAWYTVTWSLRAEIAVDLKLKTPVCALRSVKKIQ